MIARDVLAVPVTTVASESAFSYGGRLVSPSRSRLCSDTVEALMCAQNWLQKSSMTDELGQLKERSLHTVHEDEDDDLACITDNWFYDHIQQVTANSSGFECILYCIIMEAIADNAIAIGNCSMRRIRK
ncbi:Putative AC transposase [Linum perenne]